MKKFACIFCSLALMAMLYAWAPARPSVNRQVDDFIERSMREKDIPGMAIAVVKNGEIIHLNSYGVANLEWKLPVTAHTNFQIASSSKLLASTLVLKAIHQHRLNLEDPVSRYIGDVPAAWKELKVKHLITHSSGLKAFRGDLYATTASVVNSLKDSTLEYPVGTRQSYVSADYVVLRYMLEQVYQKPYEQALKEEVTGPASMKDGGFDMEIRKATWMETQPISDKSSTYYGKSPSKIPYKFLYAQYTYTAGGYFASIADMANWAIALDKQTLFPRAVEQQWVYGRDSIGNKLSGFSKVGWVSDRQDGIAYAGHSGGPGLGDILRFPGQGYTFIVLSNDGELLPGMAMMIASFYIKELKPDMKLQKFVREGAL